MPPLIQPLESLVNSPIRLSLAEPTDLVSPENIPRTLLIGEASAGTLSKRIHLPRIQPDKLIYLVGPAEDDSILTSWVNFDPNISSSVIIRGEWGLEDSGKLYRLSDGTMVLLYVKKEQMPLYDVVFDRVPAAGYVSRLQSMRHPYS